jgi:hypothetical protein
VGKIQEHKCSNRLDQNREGIPFCRCASASLTSWRALPIDHFNECLIINASYSLNGSIQSPSHRMKIGANLRLSTVDGLGDEREVCRSSC